MVTSMRLFLRHFYVVACWLVVWANPLLIAGDLMTPTAAGWTPAEIPGIAGLVSATRSDLKRTGDPSRIAAFDDVRDVMAHASEWRWYSRGNGILLAIPIRERLGIAARAEGEKALADVVRRLINQAGWGNPPVQVILVGDESPRHKVPPCQPCRESDLPAPCVCD